MAASSKGRRPRKRTRWSARQAEAVLGRWQRSGLSMRAFCEREGFDRQRLHRWKTKLAWNGARSQSSAPVALHEVEIVADEAPTATSPGALTLERPDGLLLHVGPGFDEATLDRLLGLLDGRR